MFQVFVVYMFQVFVVGVCFRFLLWVYVSGFCCGCMFQVFVVYMFQVFVVYMFQVFVVYMFQVFVVGVCFRFLLWVYVSGFCCVYVSGPKTHVLATGGASSNQGILQVCQFTCSTNLDLVFYRVLIVSLIFMLLGFSVQWLFISLLSL